MCGIGGVVLATGEVEGTWLDDMARTMRNRGPDDRGALLWRPGSSPAHGTAAPAVAGATVGLAHTRLSILDTSDAGHQPMASEDGRFHLVFNGEIYNYLELRDELQRGGHHFQSGTDTEVLLAAYREWGARCLTRLEGMFAFAVLDCEDGGVFLARDCFGIKPLLYATWPGGLAFASDVNALLALPQVSRRVDAAVLYDYLRFGLVDHQDQTFFADIHRLPAAYAARVTRESPDRLELVRYWQPTSERRDIPMEAAADELRHLFLRNVRLHLRSDVPVGAALSGGIDSSAIVAAVRQEAGPTADLRTFSYLASDPALDEERWVDLVAGATGAAVHKVRISADELVVDLDTLLTTQGEPFGSTSIYAQNRVFRLAAGDGVPVMLDGQGADELFGGYRGYLAGRFAALVRTGRFGSAARLAVGVSRLPDTHLTPAIVLKAAQRLVPARARPALRQIARRGQEVPAWMDGGWFAERGVAPEGWSSKDGGGGLGAALRATLTRTSLPALLRYEDRNSMAYSVESRTPFLTPSFVDFVLSLPEDHLIDPDGVTKAVFRRAMRGLVPDPVLDRRDKIGFTTPERSWLATAGGWVDHVLRGASTAVPALCLAEVERRWADVAAGRRPFDGQVWRWLNTVRWAELYRVDFE